MNTSRIYSRRTALGLGLAAGAAAIAGPTPGAAAERDTSFGDVTTFIRELEETGDCIVQQGSFELLDTLALASEGQLISCFGNNAGSSYLVTFLPPAPHQAPARGVPERNWPDEKPGVLYDPSDPDTFPANPYFSPAGWSYKLRPDEAVVIAATMPPTCVYFSLINYVLLSAVVPNKDYSTAKGFFAVDGPDGGASYHPIFGSLGMPVNHRSIATDAPEGSPAFGARFVYVVTGDETTAGTVRHALTAAGFGEDLVNMAFLPATSLAMGLEDGKDTFCTLGRVSQPSDPDALRAWIDSLPETATVLRVTPQEAGAAPMGPQPVVTRGTNVHELEALPQAKATLDAIRAALIERYADSYDYEEPRVDIAVPEGMTAYLCDSNAQGDNHDAAYLMSTDFALTSDDDFVVVYGVNHTATRKASYSNAILYARPMLNGVCSVYDGLFVGSAVPYMDACADDPDAYYVCTLARDTWEFPENRTAVIPWSTGNEQGVYYGVDNNNPMLAAFRAYVEPDTGVGPSYYEIVWDRVLVFHRR